MIRGLTGALKSILAFIAALVLGVLVTAAAFFFKILPDRERRRREEDAEARRRADAIKAEIAKSHAHRAQETAVAVKAIEQKAEDARSADSVALANDLLKEE